MLADFLTASTNSLLEPEEQIPRRWHDGDAVHAVAGGDGITAGRPTAASQIGILQQRVAARVRPGDGHS